MAIGRLAALMVLVLLPACTADVLLGINRLKDAGSSDAAIDDGGVLLLDAGSADAGASDAGLDDGGVTDAGTADAGLDGGGVTDAGTADAGLDDGGVTDAGTADAGLDGGGATDAGTPDAGVDGGAAMDAGNLDAGPPDLLPELSGVLAVERGDTVIFNAGVRNSGGSTALDASVSLTIPLGLSFRSGAGCTASTPQQVVCQVGDLSAQSVSTSALTLAADAGLGWRSIQAFATSETADPQPGNDTDVFRLAVTGVGNQVLPIVAPRTAFFEACFGSNLMSFAVCTPASLLSATVVLQPDGGIDTLDGGFDGVWGQSPHQRNVAFRFYFGATAGRQYAGAATTSSCFEGVGDSAGVFQNAVFRLCLQ